MTSPKKPSRHRRKASGRKRDFHLEYQRRLAKGLATGLSRPQARGHARAGERPKAPSGLKVDPRRPEELALKLMKKGVTLKAASSAEGLTQERLRRYLKENTDARRVGRTWQIVDNRPRQFPFYSKAQLVSPTLAPLEASKAGTFMHAVHDFLPDGDSGLLKPFRGDGVRDVAGKLHPFETDENTLYELDVKGELSFPEFYRIIS